MVIGSTGVDDCESQRTSDMSRVLSAVRQIVGPRAFDFAESKFAHRSDLGRNVGGYRNRKVHGLVQPNRVDEVRGVVAVFNDPAVPWALHPISTGRNWGLGSKEPARDDVVLLDLGGLDAVRALDVDQGYAVVEPGVTQGKLAEWLRGTPRMLNVTASSAHTSIVGNGLDRGVGLRQQRVDDLVGLEVVLPDGELVRVGWWPETERPTAVYPHGLGPSLLPLFLQSDLGVVTAAVVRLLPRPEAQRILRLSFGCDHLVAAVDLMRRWTANGLVGGVLKVYDLVSAEFYGGKVGEFLAHVCVDGTESSANAVAEVIAAEADSSGLFSEVHRTRVTVESDDPIVNMVRGAYAGDPSHNDAMLSATLGRTAEHVDEEGLGWLFFLPMIPFTGRSVAHAHQLLEKIYADTAVRAGCTVNALNSDVIDFVVTIKFERTQADTERAHRALDRAYELFSAAGFVPYRLDVDHAEWIDRLDPHQGARNLTRRLKQTIDPHTAIARGRYA